MDKFTKIGLSALCGSLAAVAASAGEMSVTGGATATWSSNSKDVTGNPIGLSSGLTFKGSGELDNGTTFTLSLTETDQAAFSVGSISYMSQCDFLPVTSFILTTLQGTNPPYKP